MFKLFLNKAFFPSFKSTTKQYLVSSSLASATFCEKNKKKQKANQNENKPTESNKEVQTVSQKDKARMKAVEEQYNIVHHQTESTVDTNKDRSNLEKDKKVLEALVKKMLAINEVSAENAEAMKNDIRNPLYNTKAPNLFKLKEVSDVWDNIKGEDDLYWFNLTYECFNKIFNYTRELRDRQDDNYIRIRSMDKLLKNDDIIYIPPRTVDTRQSQHSPDYLKIQPRLNVTYSYNIEQHRDFYNMYEQYKKEDLKNMIEKQKLIKYIKENPNNHAVKTKHHKLNFPVTIDKLPDYDVDINGYKPPITKKSRRKYDYPKYNTEFKNYAAWRCFDREMQAYSEEDPFLLVKLIPQKLIEKFGLPEETNIGYSTGTYLFEDENLDAFLLFEYRQTTRTEGPNYDDQFYEDQLTMVREDLRRPKYDEPEEFWSSNEEKEFRITYPRYSEVRRFKRWVKVNVNYFDKEKEKTINQILDEKYGNFDNYKDYNKERKEDSVVAVYNYSPEQLMDKNETKIIKHDPLNIPIYISIKDGGEYFDIDEHMKLEALKGLERNLNK